MRGAVFIVLVVVGLIGPVVGRDLGAVVDMVVIVGWSVLLGWSVILFLGAAPRRYQTAGALLLSVTLLAMLLPGDVVGNMKDWLAPLIGSKPPAAIVGIASDKLVHFFLFCSLGVVLALARPDVSMRRVMAELAALAIATEMLQGYVPGRSASTGDLVADVAGAWLGLMLARHVLGSPARLAR